MPLSWNEIRNRAHEFSKHWEGESSDERVWKESLEAETVPRRFGTGPGQIFRGPPMEIFVVARGGAGDG